MNILPRRRRDVTDDQYLGILINTITLLISDVHVNLS